MNITSQNKKSYYTIIRGHRIGIFHGEIKLLSKLIIRHKNPLHKCFDTEQKAIMFWHLYSSAKPLVYNVIDGGSDFLGLLITEKEEESSLW